MQAWEEPSEFHGCGKFAADSWRIFCRGQTSPKGVEDATLKRYLRWLSTGKLVEKAVASRPAKGRSGTQRRLAHSCITVSAGIRTHRQKICRWHAVSRMAEACFVVYAWDGNGFPGQAWCLHSVF